MATPNSIQQLVIDRSVKPSSAKMPLMIGLCSLLVTIGAGTYWFSSTAVADSPDAITQIKESKATKVAKENIAQQIIKANKQTSLETLPASVLDASGHVVARRIATVSSRVTGKLEALNIEEGVEVKKSQVLAELDDQQAQISYQLALADLSAQQAKYQEALVMQKFAKQKSKRREQLAQDKLISQQLSEDTQLRIEQLAAQVNNRKALVELAKQRTELALYQLNQHKIRAPFDGVVISKNAQVGELISAGSSGGGFIRTGVGTIVDMSSLEIEVEVGESYINRVFPGQNTTATLDAYPNWKINSQVVAVIPTADRQKASIKVRVKLLDIDQRVLPDMGVKVSFLQSTNNDELTASNSSL